MSKYLAWFFVILWGIFIWLLSDQPSLSSGLEQDFYLRKTAHIFEFAVFLLLIVWALKISVPKVSFASLLTTAILLAIAYAVVDEWHQTWVIGRNGDGRDVLVDSAGILIGTALIYFKKR